jgi:PAS domain S-box-containing protein
MLKAPIPENEPERIAALLSYEILDTPPEPAFDGITRLAAHILDVPMALVSLVDDERQWFKSRYGLEVTETPRDMSFCGHVVAQDGPLVVVDTLLDARFADNPLVTGSPRIRFYSGYPLRSRDNHVLGTLCALDRSPREFTAAQDEMLRALAGLVMDQLEARRNHLALLEREAHQAAVLDALPGIYFHLSKDYRFLGVRGAEYESLYMAPEGFIGRTVDEVLPPEACARMMPSLERAQQSGSVHALRYELPIGGQTEHFEARIAAKPDGSLVVLVHRVTQEVHDQQTLESQKSLLESIVRAQLDFLADVDPRQAFDRLLTDLLALTRSEYGFIGEVLKNDEGAPFLRTYAITNIAWDDATRSFYDEHAPKGMEFFNLRSLFGAAMTSERPVIANAPASDPRRGGLPPGHPPLNAFLGLPLHSADQLVGLIGLANRPGGYDEDLVKHLRPLITTIAKLIELSRHAREKEQAITALHESEVRFQTIVNTVIDAIVTIDEGGTIRQVNPAVEEMFGYPAEELVGQNVRVLMPSPHAEEHDRYLAAYLTTGKRKVLGSGREVLAKHQSGRVFPCELGLSELWLGGRRFFTGVLRDISARRESERQRDEAFADLRRSRDDLLKVLQQLRIGTLIVDAAGHVVFASRSEHLAPATGNASVAGMPWEDVLGIDGPHRTAVRAALRYPESERTRITLRLGRGEEKRWIELEIRDDPRDPDGHIFYLYDVSDVHQLRERLSRERRGQMVGDSAAMREVYSSISQVAQGDWTVLIEGETGTGKELVAQAIHQGSNRRGGPFVAVNCAGLTESILGSQLFGHVKGAFTGALTDREGLFEAAVGGTLFLDEIGDVSPPIQSALLRSLQEKEVTRLGETRPRKVDVRIIAATHRDLQERVREGLFRADLLYRIRSARVPLPPLRERRDDIPLLVASFLAEERVTAGKLVADVSPEAMARLVRHDWPGNVRELRAAIEHAVVRSRGRRIELDDLPSEVVQAPVSCPPPPSGVSKADTERDRIVATLRKTGGNRVRAARILGMGRATLYRRLDQLKITDADLDQEEPP